MRPRSLRLPLWSAFAAALGGANIVHDDGVDFAFLEPAALAIALFVLLPGAAAALVVVLVERWIRVEAWSDRRLSIGLCIGAVAGTFALGFAALLGLQRSSCAGDGSQVRSRGSRALPCRERSRNPPSARLAPLARA